MFFPRPLEHSATSRGLSPRQDNVLCPALSCPCGGCVRMRDCDPVGSIKEHTSPSGIFHNAAACTCCALEARAAACFGRWCRAQTHTAGLSPPLCVCSISARAAVLHASARPFWERTVGRLTTRFASPRMPTRGNHRPPTRRSGRLYGNLSQHVTALRLSTAGCRLLKLLQSWSALRRSGLVPADDPPSSPILRGLEVLP